MTNRFAPKLLAMGAVKMANREMLVYCGLHLKIDAH